MPRPRSVHMRTAALGGVVGLCLVVPLAAASADSSDRSDKERASRSRPEAVAPVKGAEFGNGLDGSDNGLLQPLLGATPAPSGKGTRPASPSTSPSAPAPSQSPDGPATSCGRTTESGGVRAQTCVERVGNEVRGRVYYANSTAEKVLVVLNVLQPGGESVSIRCTVAPNTREGQCESPPMKSPTGVTGWSAISEFATADGLSKLLRSGTGR